MLCCVQRQVVSCDAKLWHGRSRGRDWLQEAVDVGDILRIAMSPEGYFGQGLSLIECEVCVGNPNNGVWRGLKDPVLKNASHCIYWLQKNKEQRDSSSSLWQEVRVSVVIPR